MGYKEEQDLKQRRKQFRRRFRFMSDAEEKAIKEQQQQNVYADNIKYRKSLKRK